MTEMPLVEERERYIQGQRRCLEVDSILVLIISMDKSRNSQHTSHRFLPIILCFTSISSWAIHEKRFCERWRNTLFINHRFYARERSKKIHKFVIYTSKIMQKTNMASWSRNYHRMEKGKYSKWIECKKAWQNYSFINSIIIVRVINHGGGGTYFGLRSNFVLRFRIFSPPSGRR